MDPRPLSHLGGFDRAVQAVSAGIELAGIGVIVLGGIAALVVFGARLAHRRVFDTAWSELRQNLGRAILLGLEFLVAADIVGTVAVDPTFHNLGILGVIVLIRTFLSFALEVEIEGRWPWRGGGSTAGEGAR